MRASCLLVGLQSESFLLRVGSWDVVWSDERAWIARTSGYELVRYGIGPCEVGEREAFLDEVFLAEKGTHPGFPVALTHCAGPGVGWTIAD